MKSLTEKKKVKKKKERYVAVRITQPERWLFIESQKRTVINRTESKGCDTMCTDEIFCWYFYNKPSLPVLRSNTILTHTRRLPSHTRVHKGRSVYGDGFLSDNRHDSDAPETTAVRYFIAPVYASSSILKGSYITPGPTMLSG